MTAVDLIRGQYGLDHVVERFHDGRTTQREFDRYFWAWVWSAVRLTGVAGMIQDSYTRRHGPISLGQRIARVRAVVARIENEGKPCN